MVAIYPPNLFLVSRCETLACLVAHRAKILGGIEGSKQAHMLFKTMEFYYFSLTN